MSRTQNLRWKRKALVVAAVAVSFGGYAAIGSSTVSASNYSEWDCSGNASVTEQTCPVATDDYTSDTVIDTIPEDSIPVDTTPVDTTPVVTDPVTTLPSTTQPSIDQQPPAPTVKPVTVVTPAPVVAPAAVVAPALPVTGRGSALPTVFIAIGLLGAGSVALAFARRNQATRSNHS